MLAALPVEEITIVREVPVSFINYERRCSSDMILNDWPKRSYKSAEDVIFQNTIISIGIEFDMINKLYYKYRNLFGVSFKTFFEAYNEVSKKLKDIIPDKCNIFTNVSTEDECLYNYCEYDDKKIFINIFFEEEFPIAQVNIHSNGKFYSNEGTIESVSLYLKTALE